MVGMKKNPLGFTQVEVGHPGVEFPRYPDIEIRVCEKRAKNYSLEIPRAQSSPNPPRF